VAVYSPKDAGYALGSGIRLMKTAMGFRFINPPIILSFFVAGAMTTLSAAFMASSAYEGIGRLAGSFGTVAIVALFGYFVQRFWVFRDAMPLVGRSPP
jgi:hypothetical protein